MDETQDWQANALAEADKLRRELRHREIRRPLANLDPLLVPTLYARGDDETRAAMRSAPLQVVPTKHGVDVRPLVAPEVVEEYAIGAADVIDPEHAQLVRDLRYLEETYTTLANVFRTELETAAGVSLGAETIVVVGQGAA